MVEGARRAREKQKRFCLQVHVDIRGFAVFFGIGTLLPEFLQQTVPNLLCKRG